MNDDFYVGYDTPVPASARARVFGAARLALATLAASVTILVTNQSPLPAATFAFGAGESFSGVIRLDPYPAIDTAAGRVYLVATGKHGAEDLMARFAGHVVELRGAPIARQGFRLVEVIEDSVRVLDRQAAGGLSEPVLEDLGVSTLAGEIVDGKCYGGVMNPGEGTVHRDCARACLRGGLPAFFAVRTAAGRTVLFELQSEMGQAIGREAAAIAGRTVSVSGRVLRVSDGRWILRTTLPGTPSP